MRERRRAGFITKVVQLGCGLKLQVPASGALPIDENVSR
jgi:hypothetical protein